jgi:GH15 family glucan-1,4-alpha-glucosidase
MTRSLILGNGRLLINFDERYWIRDIYFPHLGIENHTEGHPSRFGIAVDGVTHWVDERWERSISYDDCSLVSRVELRHEGIGIAMLVRDAVDREVDALCREITLTDLSGRTRDVRIFHHQDFYISGTEVGDTALYDPDLDAIIQYKRNRYFMIGGGTAPDYRFDVFATGKKKFAGAEGTWRDAEDGQLGGNPIAQGSVDSTIGVDVVLPARGEARAYYWIGAGERYGDLLKVNSRIRRHGPGSLVNRTAAYWRHWVRSEVQEFHGLPQNLIDLYRTSLLVMRAHVDHEGAIIAATDSDITQFARDTYTYMWPRDGALTVDAFDRAGYPAVARQFFRFATGLLKREGYYLHKYHPDRSLASSWHPWLNEHGEKILPIQEDETGLVVWALWRHYVTQGDLEDVHQYYRSFVVRAADFMSEYRDHATGLPLPSWDLWEERRGVLTFTCAAVWAGLDAAARFADAFGDTSLELRFRGAADEIRAAMIENLWDEASGRFLRMLVPAHAGSKRPEIRDATPDASLFGLHFLGIFDTDDPKLVQTLASIEQALTVRTSVGGLARYSGDYYHAVTDDWGTVPGNPWFIGQSWIARWRMAQARTADELQDALEPLQWMARYATEANLLPEQVHPFTAEPLAVTPLTWSHASFVSAVHDYLDRSAALGRIATETNTPHVRQG